MLNVIIFRSVRRQRYLMSHRGVLIRHSTYMDRVFLFSGLWRDDLQHVGSDIEEALKRVPQSIIDERNFRIIRAMQLDMQHKVLPKEQWTKFEEVTWIFIVTLWMLLVCQNVLFIIFFLGCAIPIASHRTSQEGTRGERELGTIVECKVIRFVDDGSKY